MIALERHSYFWVGAESVELPDGGVVSAGTQMYVEEFVPAERRHEHPLVFVHGGGGQGIAFMGRGDGHPGWLHHALAEGYAVYLPDRPGHGRNPPHPQLVGPTDAPTPYAVVTAQFKVGAAGGRWPGTGEVDDPGVAQFMAQQRPMRFDTAEFAHEVSRRRAAELLDRIGPAIVIAHSAGGPFGWLAADARPGLVKALVSVEALGPALLGVPLAFDPPASSVSELSFEPYPDPPGVDLGGLAALPRVVQKEPARRLTALSQVPIMVLTSDDPAFGALNAGSIAFLRQAGCEVEELRLADLGIHGNGHFMPLEDNNREVLRVILDWVERAAG